MTQQPHRRESRHSINFPVRLVWDRRSYVSMVEDVSFRGLCIRTDAMPPLRLLVRVDLHLPHIDKPLSLHAMVAHTTIRDRAAQMSLGLQLYGISEEERSLWHAFVERVRLDTTRRSYQNVSLVSILEPATTGELLTLGAKARAGRSIVVPTALPAMSGERVVAIAVHPREPGRMFTFEGIVERCLSGSDGAGGLGHTGSGALVKLRAIGAADQHAYAHFVQPGRSASVGHPSSEARAA